MASNRRSQLVVGSLLILLGIWFFTVQVAPGMRFFLDGPMVVIAIAVGLFLFGVAVGAPAMAIPASIVGGIGGILAWQSATGDAGLWFYAWTLIPGFVGVGIMLAGLLEGDLRSRLQPGGWLILISTVLFTFFGFFLGGGELVGAYWPVLLILLGLILLAQSLLGGRARRRDRSRAPKSVSGG